MKCRSLWWTVKVCFVVTTTDQSIKQPSPVNTVTWFSNITDQLTNKMHVKTTIKKINYSLNSSVVVKDSRTRTCGLSIRKKGLKSKDKQIGPRVQGLSSRTTTLLDSPSSYQLQMVFDRILFVCCSLCQQQLSVQHHETHPHTVNRCNHLCSTLNLLLTLFSAVEITEWPIKTAQLWCS